MPNVRSNLYPWREHLRAVLFDLDGTLADTGLDLTAALNHVLVEEGHPPIDYAQIRPIISQGALAMVLRGFSLSLGDPAANALRQRLVDFYSAHIADYTRLFPGMDEVLLNLENRGIQWGIVTNKPAWLTEPLVEKLGLTQRSCCTVSGDTLPEKKPHPAPVLYACAQAGSDPAQCLFIGDAYKDIQAGQQAGARTAVALFGYLGEEETPPAAWGADLLLAEPLELLTWLKSE